jgi:hypothetical protein
MAEIRHIPVSEIREGDRFLNEESLHPYWTATEDAVTGGDGETAVGVRFPDGGTSYRVWDDASHQLPIARDEWPEETVIV